MVFRFSRSFVGRVGLGLITYALLIYPLIGLLGGHGYPAGPTIGVPCPTTIFTFGLFLWAADSMPYHLLIIPVFWAVFAAPAALGWGVIEDVVMPVAALLVVAVCVTARRSRSGVGVRGGGMVNRI